MLGAAGVREDVAGLENLPAGTCVFVCNHQSNFDAPFVFAHLPKHIRFVAKQELYRIPIFGAAVKAMGNIRVERTGSEGDRKRIEAAIEQVRTRISILFFAEGTAQHRRQAAALQEGRGGPRHPGAGAARPHGGRRRPRITPKGSLWVHSGRPLVLRVGKPIPTTGLGREDRDTLTLQAHDAVATLLEEGNRRVQEMLPHERRQGHEHARALLAMRFAAHPWHGVPRRSGAGGGDGLHRDRAHRRGEVRAGQGDRASSGWTGPQRFSSQSPHASTASSRRRTAAPQVASAAPSAPAARTSRATATPWTSAC